MVGRHSARHRTAFRPAAQTAHTGVCVVITASIDATPGVADAGEKRHTLSIEIVFQTWIEHPTLPNVHAFPVVRDNMTNSTDCLVTGGSATCGNHVDTIVGRREPPPHPHPNKVRQNPDVRSRQTGCYRRSNKEEGRHRWTTGQRENALASSGQ